MAWGSQPVFSGTRSPEREAQNAHSPGLVVRSINKDGLDFEELKATFRQSLLNLQPIGITCLQHAFCG